VPHQLQITCETQSGNQVSLIQTPLQLVIQCDFSNFCAPSQNVAGDTVYQFSGLELQDLELCAGTARLTKTVRAQGIRGLAVEKCKSRTVN